LSPHKKFGNGFIIVSNPIPFIEQSASVLKTELEMDSRINSKSKENIVIFGGSGLVGSAIATRFQTDSSVRPSQVFSPLHSEIDLADSHLLKEYITGVSPELIIMAAGEVGGISYNASHQAEMYSSNLIMNYNLLKVAFELKVSKLLLVSSSCLYPAHLPPPFLEDNIFSGLPESTNDGYAAAKLSAIRQLLMYRNNYGLNWQVCIPTNVYGLGDTKLEKAHVIPQMIHKIMMAKMTGKLKVEFYGDGTPIREFIYNSDLGDAVHWIHSTPVRDPIVNISVGSSITMLDLAKLVASVCDYDGELFFNSNFPNGHPNKSLHKGIMTASGWKSKTSLENGIKLLVTDYRIRHLGIEC
jgi:GDP-L-fucose synthase